jgi:hypothetical protein
LDWTECTAPHHAELLRIYKSMLALRAKDRVLAKTNEIATCEEREGVLIVRRRLGREERTLIFNTRPEPAPAPVALAEHEILLTSAPALGSDTIPARSSFLLRAIET